MTAEDIFLFPLEVSDEYGVYGIAGFSTLFLTLIGVVVILTTREKLNHRPLYLISTFVMLISPWFLIPILGDSLEIFHFVCPLFLLVGITLLFFGIKKKLNMVLAFLPISVSIGYWSIGLFGEITANI